MFLSVIIPAYNEEKRLPETLKKVKGYLSRQSYDWEVLIVNDGSKDGTAGAVRKFIKAGRAGKAKEGEERLESAPDSPTNPTSLTTPNFRLIDNKENKGKGGVVKQGMLEAKGEWRLFMDADNSTDISEIEKLFKASKAGMAGKAINGDRGLNAANPALNSPTSPTGLTMPNCDIIIGSRYLNKDSIKIKQPLMRRIASRMGNWLIRILLGIKMVDTQCGFKLLSAQAAKEIFPLQTIERWGFDMEILAIAKRRGYKIKDVAVDWYDAEGSQVKKSTAFKTLKELFIIKWNLMRGKYS